MPILPCTTECVAQTYYSRFIFVHVVILLVVGRIWNHKRAGGHKRNFRMIDWVRGGPSEGNPAIEKVNVYHIFHSTLK